MTPADQHKQSDDGMLVKGHGGGQALSGDGVTRASSFRPARAPAIRPLPAEKYQGVMATFMNTVKVSRRLYVELDLARYKLAGILLWSPVGTHAGGSLTLSHVPGEVACL